VRLRAGLPALAAALAFAGWHAAAVDAVGPREARLEADTAAALYDYWSAAFGRIGRPYAGPKGVVWYDTPTFMGCGITSVGSSTYCRVDRTIYLDVGLFSRSLGNIGDFAAATILAHEWGHEVQDELGLFSWAVLHRYWIGKELQADCYAGMFLRHATKVGLLSGGDVAEGTALLASLGDGPDMKRSSPQAHGTPTERVGWFLRGFQTGSRTACNSVYRKLYKARR
jgi:predicted metalloprotease